MKIINSKLKLNFRNWKEYTQILYRLLTNPNSEIINILERTLIEYPIRNQTLGLHIRSGGLLANWKEGTYWVTYEEMPFLIRFINKSIKSRGFFNTLFITTDSNIVEKYIKNHISNITILDVNPYRRYHTTVGDSESFKSSIFDLYLSSLCKSIMYTPSSSFSYAILSISRSKSQIKLPLKRRQRIH